MRLSKGAIDKLENTCYQEQKEGLSAFIVEPKGGINKERLIMALNLILSEKDVTDYFVSDYHSFSNHQKN